MKLRSTAASADRVDVKPFPQFLVWIGSPENPIGKEPFGAPQGYLSDRTPSEFRHGRLILSPLCVFSWWTLVDLLAALWEFCGERPPAVHSKD